MSGQGSIGGYEIVARGGRGGVGVVYRCRAPGGGEVAVKLLHPGATEEHRRRFKTEAEALRRVSHPHVLRIFDQGVWDGTPYLVTEWVDGETLQQRLERSGPLPPREAAWLTATLARALAHLHGQGILHRDLNPQNVLLRSSGEPLIIDFGLAKDLLPGASPTTSVRGRSLGTPAYWPPEQARGDVAAIGAWSDVYGLGGVLFAALTGEPPHRGDTLLEQMSAPERLPELHPRLKALIEQRVDPVLWEVCMRALTPEPRRRQQKAQELAGELEAWLNGGTKEHAP